MKNFFKFLLVATLVLTCSVGFAFANFAQTNNDKEISFVTYGAVTDPETIAKHEMSMNLFSDVLGTNILEVPAYEEGALPPYITVEIVSVVLFEGIPNKIPNEGWGNANYSSGSLIGLYSGPTTYVRSSNEYIGDGWWAIALWFQGTLDLHHTGSQ